MSPIFSVCLGSISAIRISVNFEIITAAAAPSRTYIAISQLNIQINSETKRERWEQSYYNFKPVFFVMPFHKLVQMANLIYCNIIKLSQYERKKEKERK